jgi:hypothetical protein
MLDGLGEAEDDAWNVLAKRLLHRLDELLSRAVSPGVTRLERYEDVGHLDAHRVHGDLGAPGLADHGLNLRKLAQRSLERRRLPCGFGEARARESIDLERDGTLVELGNELGAARRRDANRAGEQPDRDADGRDAVTQDHVERASQPIAKRRDHSPLRLLRMERQHQRGEDRRQRDGQDERGGKREDDCERHRPEHLPLDALKREDREVDDRDDELSEGRGGSHLERRTQDQLVALRGRQRATQGMASAHSCAARRSRR